MESIYELLTQAADILDRAQNRLIASSASELNARLYDLRCELEDLREDVQENI
jgi:outer membrane murein-binding lipoprotein Lpp